MDAAVLLECVESAEAVFGNDDRQVIAARDVAATDTDADRIDGPIPIGCLLYPSDAARPYAWCRFRWSPFH